MTGFLDLPDELVLWIHFLAEEPSLPLVHPHFYTSLHHAPISYISRYLLSLYRSQPPLQRLPSCLRHPICDIPVVQEIQRQCDRSGITIACPTLPTRLFRVTTIPPLLRHLFDTYTPSPNLPNGYPLSRAVLSSNPDLIQYLLDKGAHPGMRGGLAVRTAVQMGRLDLVRLLVEPSKDSSPKRQRREDRYKVGSELVELAVKVNANDIVQYFVEKGVMPPLRSIMQMKKRKR